eukprot:CAMPEP_0175380578 /NCGR_PEP_ID=MMETSP0095-20121207/26389_1 /TAXON_ID=311494 /ORGANISM="Alexandrium monilatum, Strain CCMP3105" /LENGTH=320 /DNA_ID=CAMNT_0016678949 /DNA_START=141 /DNA_END=1100 /DNA_ORIENTATION=-
MTNIWRGTSPSLSLRVARRKAPPLDALEMLVIDGREDVAVTHQALEHLGHFARRRPAQARADGREADALGPLLALGPEELQDCRAQWLARQRRRLGRRRSAQAVEAGGGRLREACRPWGRLLRWRGRQVWGGPSKLQRGVGHLDHVEAHLVRGLHGRHAQRREVELRRGPHAPEEADVAAQRQALQVLAAGVAAGLDAACAVADGELRAGGLPRQRLDQAHEDQDPVLGPVEAEALARPALAPLRRRPDHPHGHGEAGLPLLLPGPPRAGVLGGGRGGLSAHRSAEGITDRAKGLDTSEHVAAGGWESRGRPVRCEPVQS